MSEITVTLPDGSLRTLENGATLAELASDIGPGLAKAAVIGEVNGIEVDLDTTLTDGSLVSIITDTSDQGLETLRHSTAHVLAQAVLDIYPGATFAIGPPIENGFYYDFSIPNNEAIKEENLALIEERMSEIITADQAFKRGETSVEEALLMFSDHPYKCEIIEAADL